MADLWMALLEDLGRRVNSSSEKEDVQRLQRAVTVAFQAVTSALAGPGKAPTSPTLSPLEGEVTARRSQQRKSSERAQIRPIDASHETMLHLLSSLPCARTNKRMRNYLKELLGRNVAGSDGGGAPSVPAALSWMRSVAPLGFAPGSGPSIHLALLEGDIKLERQYREIGPYLRSDLGSGHHGRATASVPMFTDGTLHCLETVEFAAKFLRWSDHRCSAKNGAVLASAQSIQRRRIAFVVSDLHFQSQRGKSDRDEQHSSATASEKKSEFPIVVIREEKQVSVLRKHGEGKSVGKVAPISVSEYTSVHVCEGLDADAVTELTGAVKKHLSHWEKHPAAFTRPSSSSGKYPQTLNLLQVVIVLDADGHEMCDGMLRLAGSSLLPKLGQLHDALSHALDEKQREHQQQQASTRTKSDGTEAGTLGAPPPLHVEFEYHVVIAGSRTLQLACPEPRSGNDSRLGGVADSLRDLFIKFPNNVALVFPSTTLFSPHIRGDLHANIDKSTHSTVDVAVSFYNNNTNGVKEPKQQRSTTQGDSNVAAGRDTLVSLLLSYNGENTMMSIPLARFFFQLWCTTSHPPIISPTASSSGADEGTPGILVPVVAQQHAYIKLLHTLADRVDQLTRALTAPPVFPQTGSSIVKPVAPSSPVGSSPISVVTADAVSIIVSVAVPATAAFLLQARSHHQSQVACSSDNNETGTATIYAGTNLLALGLSSIFASFGISVKRYEHGSSSAGRSSGTHVLLGFSPLTDVSDLTQSLQGDLPVLVSQIEMFRESLWSVVAGLRESLPQDISDYFSGAKLALTSSATSAAAAAAAASSTENDHHRQGNILPAGESALSSDQPVEERQVFLCEALDLHDEEALQEAEVNGELGNALVIPLVHAAVIPKPFLLPALESAASEESGQAISTAMSDTEILTRLVFTPEDLQALTRLRRVLLRELMNTSPTSIGAAALSKVVVGSSSSCELEGEVLIRLRASPLPVVPQQVPMIMIGIELDSGALSHAVMQRLCERISASPRLLLDIRTPIGLAVGRWIDEALERTLNKSEDVMKVQEQVLVQAIHAAEKILQGEMPELVPNDAYRSNSGGGSWFSFLGWGGGSGNEASSATSSGSLNFNMQTSKLTRKLHLPREAESATN